MRTMATQETNGGWRRAGRSGRVPVGPSRAHAGSRDRWWPSWGVHGLARGESHRRQGPGGHLHTSAGHARERANAPHPAIGRNRRLAGCLWAQHTALGGAQRAPVVPREEQQHHEQRRRAQALEHGPGHVSLLIVVQRVGEALHVRFSSGFDGVEQRVGVVVKVGKHLQLEGVLEGRDGVESKPHKAQALLDVLQGGVHAAEDPHDKNRRGRNNAPLVRRCCDADEVRHGEDDEREQEVAAGVHCSVPPW
mmetsp:Transcript_15734/g.53410  ORF Transcript_15734/g.53410 Transcript_15734/m.53410 type:complete len:250 (-) Transcript_15734:1371-2120(-)